MVQDLTANGDFNKSENSLDRLFRHSRDLLTANEDNPKDDLVFTGDALDRQTKRFYKDYETEKNMCDCCGGPIDRIPWHFGDENKTLCSVCESIFTKEYKRELFENVTEIIADTGHGFILAKPWTMREDFEDNRAIDNVLLWD